MRYLLACLLVLGGCALHRPIQPPQILRYLTTPTDWTAPAQYAGCQVRSELPVRTGVPRQIVRTRDLEGRRVVIAVLLLLLAVPTYHRAEYRHWLDADRDCQDARQEVLIAESRQPVRLTSDGCRVVWGDWLDRYTGEQTNDPRALDCDHVAALGWVHQAGGWRWSREQKAAYANDLHPEHLIAVTLEANRQKGAKGPDKWRPRKANWCEYANAWLVIARRWGLTMTRAEWDALMEMRATCPR